MNMSDYGVKTGIKADTGIMLLKPSTVSAVVNIVGSRFQSGTTTYDVRNSGHGLGQAHTCGAVINRFVGSQIYPVDNWISNDRRL